MFIPVYVALIFVTTFFIANYVGKISTRPAARAVLTIDGNVLFSCYGTVIYSFYIAVVSQSISLFQVYSHPNGKRSLVAYPQVIFGDSQWMAVLPVGIMGILLFCVGFMCTFTYIVIVAPFCFNIEAFRKRWRFLFLKFHPRVWWWTLIVLLKALLVNLATVFFSAGVLQVWWLALMCLIYGNACFTCLPWRFFSSNIADLALHMILVFIAALSTHFADQKNWSEGQISRLVIGVSFIPFLLYVAICLVQLQKLRSPSSPEDFEEEARIMVQTFQSVTDEKVLASLLQVLATRDVLMLQETNRIIQAELLGQQLTEEVSGKSMFKVRQLTYDNFARQVLKVSKEDSLNELKDRIQVQNGIHAQDGLEGPADIEGPDDIEEGSSNSKREDHDEIVDDTSAVKIAESTRPDVDEAVEAETSAMRSIPPLRSKAPGRPAAKGSIL